MWCVPESKLIVRPSVFLIQTALLARGQLGMLLGGSRHVPYVKVMGRRCDVVRVSSTALLATEYVRLLALRVESSKPGTVVVSAIAEIVDTGVALL